MNQQLAVAASTTDASRPAEGEGRVFSGTLVTQGTAQGRVVATGERSALGRIGKSLAGLGGENTPIQNETREVVKRVAIVGLLLAASLAIAYWASTGDWLHGLLAGLTLAMAVLPEELPVVLTLFLGLGAWRLAREKVLARSIPAVELLGATTVLCVDKTGTLTANRMAVRRLWTDADAYDSAKAGSGPLQEALHGILEFAVLASHRRAFDPMETAIGAAGRRLLAGTEHLHGDWTLVADDPLSREMLAMSRVWQSPDRKAPMIAAKGAPEAIVDLCHMDATQGHRLRGRGARAHRRPVDPAGDVRLADAVDAGAHPLPAVDHRPGVIGGVRGRAPGSRCDERAAAPARRPLVRQDRVDPQPVARHGTADFAAWGLCVGTRFLDVGRCGPCNDVLSVGDVQPGPDLRQPILESVRAAGTRWIEPCIHLDRRCDRRRAWRDPGHSCSQRLVLACHAVAHNAFGRARCRGVEPVVVRRGQVGPGSPRGPG